MFAHLSTGWQYVYVLIFSFLSGLLAPFGGGFGFFAISLAVGSGAVVLARNGWEERLLSSGWSLFVPGFYFLVIAVLFVKSIQMMASEVGGGWAGIFLFFAIAFLLSCFLAYIPVRVMHLSGCLLGVAIAAAGIGLIVGFLLFSWASVDIGNPMGPADLNVWMVFVPICCIFAVQYFLLNCTKYLPVKTVSAKTVSASSVVSKK